MPLEVSLGERLSVLPGKNAGWTNQNVELLFCAGEAQCYVILGVMAGQTAEHCCCLQYEDRLLAVNICKSQMAIRPLSLALLLSICPCKEWLLVGLMMLLS